MSLLREIQSAAVDSSTDVPTLLRKCKILAARLRNKDFNNWVDNELNGYSDAGGLPKYRILQVESYGHFSGSFGRSLSNAPIPPSCLPEEFWDRATRCYLTLPISSYSALMNTTDRSNARETWPADMLVCFGRQIYEDMNCLSAWKVIPYGALAALLDTIRNRVLNFALEIEGDAPDAGEAPPNAPPLSQERVSQVFNTYISGSVQNLASGSAHVAQGGELIVKGDFDSLSDYLTSLGVDDSDLVDLETAIEADSRAKGAPNLGERVQAWMGRMVGKAASGAWGISASVASTVIGKSLSKYFGLE